jgi:DNA polymerase I-like protein with 3'-5' exonuclease and polymerase domains
MESHVVMAIHDASCVEAPQEEANEARHLMRRMLTSAGKLRIPLEVDIK